MEKEKKNLKWWAWLLIGIALISFAYITWTDGFKDGYNKGYDDNAKVNDLVLADSTEYLVKLSLNRCLNYHCDNYFTCEDPSGLLDAVNECSNILQYEDKSNRGYFNG